MKSSTLTAVAACFALYLAGWAGLSIAVSLVTGHPVIVPFM